MANGTRQWVEKLVSTPLPVQKASAKLLTKQIKEQASLADMAHTVARDPALCLHLFRAANRVTQSDDAEVLSLNHVMSTLGMQGIIDIVKKAPKIQTPAKDAFRGAYVQAQISSGLSGFLAEHWGQKCHIGNPERLKWAAILAGAPYWGLWRIGYQKMRQWQWQVWVEGKHHQTVEQQLFGSHLEDIVRIAGRQLGLPNLAQHSLERAELPDTKQWAMLAEDNYREFMDEDASLRHLWRKPETLLSILQRLSQQQELGWWHGRNQMFHIMLAHLSNQPLFKAYQQHHQIAVAYSREFSMVDGFLPAYSLVWSYTPETPFIRRPVDCVQQAQDAVVAKPKKTVPKVEKPRAANVDLIQELVTKFRQQVSDFENIHDILLTTNRALYEGLGMQRVFVCVLNKDGSALRPLYCQGVSKESPIRSLKIVLDKNRLFSKLLNHQSSFKVDKSNYRQAQNMLSSDVVMTLGQKDFMAMSLFANDKPIGVVYADTTGGESPLTEKEYKAFKTICQGASHALGAFARQRSS
ncbi:HDOD domain-containing protein [Bermanella marisrubri]|nr:HDOD domain-containing protein [Bermanella marisrubri]QIZ85396.1 HDOD domain-containing protein [Bermanella marisrubri]